jgi:hypothetical protein
MKKSFLLLITFGLLWNTLAQDSTLYYKTEKYVKRLDSIHEKLSEKLLNQTLKFSETTPDSLVLFGKILDNYQENMEYLLFFETEQYKAELGIVQPEKDFEPVYKTISKTIIKKISKPKDTVKPATTKRKRNAVQFVLKYHWGINNFSGQDSRLTDSSAYKIWGSQYFSVALNWIIPLDKKNKIRAITGAEFLWSYLKPEKNNMFHKIDENNKLILTDYGVETENTQLRTAFVKFPLGLEFSLGNKWKIGLHAYGKVYVSGKQRLEYTDRYAEYDIKEKRYFNQNKFIYGIGGYIGLKGMQIYFGTDFAPYFKDYNMNLYQIGLIL